uniref:S9 family peptidase n=1 Tax=Flavobacterium sp. Root935 TaxID=1736610 RepID=UPI0009EBE946|nr:prolyl oligopeptidase family serine peptidase [Flavobacterium sp. Root935]
MNTPHISFFTQKRNLTVTFFLFLYFVLQLDTCSLWGQVTQKRTLTADDYSKWGELSLDKLSPNGLWASYTLKYESRSDTLFVKNTKSEKVYSIPSAYSGNFIEKNWFICRSSKHLQLINLDTGQKEIIHDATQYSYNSNSRQLVILLTRKDRDNELIVRTPEGIIKEQIYGVTQFLPSSNSKEIAYVVRTNLGSTVNILTLSNINTIKKIASDTDIFTDLIWQGNEKKALAFYTKTGDAVNAENILYYYNLASSILYNSKKIQPIFLGDSVYISSSHHKLKISDDLKHVFFIVQKKNAENNSNDGNAQLWYANTSKIFPQEKNGKSTEGVYLALWTPEDGKCRMISSDSLPQFMLTGKQHHAILFNTSKYGPNYSEDDLSDFYIYDLNTGKKTLFLSKNNAHHLLVIPSPEGKYISYFRDQNWWIYNIEKKSHICLTQKTGTFFFHNNRQLPHNEEVYQQFGWTAGDNELLLYDDWDLWAFKPDGRSFRRLTNGKESNTQFRHPAYSRVMRGKVNYNGWILEAVDLKKGILLERITEYGTQGCDLLAINGNKNLVTSDKSRLDQLNQSADYTTLIYREEQFDLSPRLVVINRKGLKKVLIQSNPQQLLFHWGTNKLISYKNKSGKPLKAVLYYPANYDPQKKYPMIVYIYEKLSNKFYSYFKPTLQNGIGFNTTNYTTQGYFVLMPDITYEIGNPGISAVDCVVSAVNEVLNKDLVIPGKIGLIGHSFGGYETSFIITQTNLFATAVAGSAPTDLTSFYLSVGGATGKPDIWRFESQQLRMGNSLFADREGYMRNSPIEHVENISTPLLAWTGDADLAVKPDQSIGFFLGLRRLNKKHIMLVYPKEGHILSDSKNQKDLSVRLNDWFAYFLKNESPASWIEKGLK